MPQLEKTMGIVIILLVIVGVILKLLLIAEKLESKLNTKSLEVDLFLTLLNKSDKDFDLDYYKHNQTRY
jgi:hypothetical protein